jgi:hypothetical protein
MSDLLRRYGLQDEDNRYKDEESVCRCCGGSGGYYDRGMAVNPYSRHVYGAWEPCGACGGKGVVSRPSRKYGL